MAAPRAILADRLATPSDGGCEGGVPIRVPRETVWKRRWRAVADDGTEVAVDLDEPVADGAVLSAGERRFVVVQSAEEVVALALPADPRRAAQIGWYLGNRHIPIEVRADEILVEAFPTLTESLERIGIPHECRHDVLRCRPHSGDHRH